MTGTFEWRSGNVVQWVPDKFWPAHLTITMMAGESGAPSAPEHRPGGVGSISNHTFTVSIDGGSCARCRRRWQTEIPDPGRAVQRAGEVQVDRDGLRTIGIPWRIRRIQTHGRRCGADHLGGVYVHSAPWSLGSQGYANVSHGCINLSPDNALWYFGNVGIGDPVVINW